MNLANLFRRKNETFKDKNGSRISKGFYYRPEENDIIYVSQNPGPNFHNWLYDTLIADNVWRGELSSQKTRELIPIPEGAINFIINELNLDFIKSRPSQLI